MATTGDLRLKWREGGAPMSDDLPSTTRKPNWWHLPPVQEPVARYATSVWNCCPNPKPGELHAAP